MRKSFIPACCLLLATTASAWCQTSSAHPTGNPSAAETAAAASVVQPNSVFSASTVNDFLVACRTDQGGCVDEVGNAFMDKFEYKGDLCLPSVEYAAPVPAWLTSHAETHTMPTEDGIYLALKSLYPCD